MSSSAKEGKGVVLEGWGGEESSSAKAGSGAAEVWGHMMVDDGGL